MKQQLGWLSGAALVALLGIVGAATAQDYPFVFRDVGDKAGLFPHVSGIKGHGAAWGDIDGDGWIDLYVATFYSPSTKRNMLFRNQKGKFQVDDQEAPRLAARATGVIFADLNNDGRLDLYVSSMPKPAKPGQDKVAALAGCSLFRNDGKGKLTNISAGNGACPPAFGGRSATVLDFDGDGLLDLLVGEDPLPGYNGSKTKSSRLFRNRGDLQFEDVSRAVGLPADIPGLGVAVGDVNNDGWPDFFLAANRGGNVLFLNDGKGKFREAPGSRKLFAWPDAVGDDTSCGVCIADINRDGLLDIIVGHHYQRPWLQPVPIRVYINRGIKDGVPVFEEVTAEVGMVGLPMKPPHVEVQDFDNDGWPDIVTSIVRFKDAKPYPVIFKNLGVQKDGLPRFRETTAGVNDFPTAEDKAIKNTTVFFDKVIKEKKIIYSAPGPSGDFDNDGRLDLFLANWWEQSRSLLLRNETPGGNWLQVQVEGGKGVNCMGIGARVKLYTAGKLGEAKALLGCREISTGYGYASGQPALAHFGLGKAERVDIEVILPHGKGAATRHGVQANQRLTLKREGK